MKIENCSPLDPIHSVFLGSPGTEALLGLVLPPSISLFESKALETSSIVQARADHHRLEKALQKEGIVTYNMRHIIGRLLADRASHDLTSKDKFLAELKARAVRFHTNFAISRDLSWLLKELEELFDIDVKSMGLESAIAINGVLTNIIDIQGNFRECDPIKYPPIANFIFWRDTHHITDSKIATHTMRYLIRDQEVRLAEIAFDTLDIEYVQLFPDKSALNNQLSQVNNPSIEGGDVLSFELNNQQYAVIGTAERTSWEAVEAWYRLHEDAFSSSGGEIIPAVVEGPTSNTQDQMHLDTFVQQVAPAAIIHCGEITHQRQISYLQRRGDNIVKVRTDDGSRNFGEWLEDKAQYTYKMSRAEQLAYAPNVLVHGSNTGETTVFITRDGTPQVTRFIDQHAAKTVLLRMNELTKLYGGAHCATSEVRTRRNH